MQLQACRDGTARVAMSAGGHAAETEGRQNLEQTSAGRIRDERTREGIEAPSIHGRALLSLTLPLQGYRATSLRRSPAPASGARQASGRG